MWQRLRISFDRSFTKSVWKQAAWFALFFFIFLIVFSLLGMFPVLRDVEDDSSNTFERIFYLLSTKQNYSSLIKGSNLLRWGYYTFVMILGSVVFGGMVSIISNMLTRHVSRYQEGGVTYKLGGHVVIMGYDSVVPELARRILSHGGYDGCQVVIMSDQPSQTVQKKVYSALSDDQQKRCFVYYGKQDSKADLARLCLPQARRVFIKGNTDDNSHDSVNIRTLQLTVDILRERRETEDGRLPVTVDFNDPATYSAFQVTDLSDDWRSYVALTPYNIHEDWARQVFVDRRCYRNGKGWINYPALDGKGIDPLSDKHVHLVIIGTGQAAMTMGIQAAQLLHFPNALEHPENSSRITFVDGNAARRMDEFRHRFKHFFETEETDYLDLTAKPESHKTLPPSAFSGDDARLVNVRFGFVNGQAESEAFDNLIAGWAADERQLLRVIVATDDYKRNMSIALYLPDVIYDRDIPVLVQQETSGFLLQLLHRSDNGKYSNLYSFGTKEPTYDISERSLILAKSLNYLYCHVSITDPEWSAESMMQWDNARMLKAWDEAERLWQDLSVANQWSNIYCAHNIFGKLRSLGIGSLNGCRLLTEEETETLARVEHNRWTTEKLLMGFRKPTRQEQQDIEADDARTMTKAGPSERKVFRELKKRYIHGDICRYEMLYENEKDHDKVVVAHIPWLIKMYDLILKRISDMSDAQ